VSQIVRIDVEEAVAVVTVDNPPVNAMGDATLRGLDEAVKRIAGDMAIRAVVVTGAGEKAFMAGADIAEFEEVLADPRAFRAHTEWTGEMFARWATVPQPVVAAVQASAVGGGLEFALLCDLVVADPRARFGLPEVRLGLIPGAGGTQRLPRRIGALPAKDLLLTGRLVGADEALRLGLVNSVSEPGQALAEARALAARIAALPRVAVAAVKQAVDGRAQAELAEGLEAERRLVAEAFASDDFREGARAFLEKRKPQFTHR
jgi:enoyl-CoA hydratase/carnithine racemase